MLNRFERWFLLATTDVALALEKRRDQRDGDSVL